MLAEVSIHVPQFLENNPALTEKKMQQHFAYKFVSTQQLAFWPNWTSVISIPIILPGLFEIYAS